MEHYRRTAHTRFDIKYHLVWITKYRKKILKGDVGLRVRQIVRTTKSLPIAQKQAGWSRLQMAYLSVSDEEVRAAMEIIAD